MLLLKKNGNTKQNSAVLPLPLSLTGLPGLYFSVFSGQERPALSCFFTYKK
jgi:hypothetical protein